MNAKFLLCFFLINSKKFGFLILIYFTVLYGMRSYEAICVIEKYTVSYSWHGGLSQWGRSNRPRIRPGTVKSLNAPWEFVIVSPPTGLCQENWPLSYISLVRATYWTIGSGQYTPLSGRPVQTGQVLFEFKFTMAQSDGNNLFHNKIWKCFFLTKNTQSGAKKID